MSHPVVQPVNLDTAKSVAIGEPIAALSSILQDVEVSLEFRLGTARLPARDVMDWKSGSVVRLDQKVGEPVDVLLNQSLVARGLIVAVEDQFGVRITEVLSSKP